MHGEKDRWELQKNAACCFEQVLEAIAAVRPPTSHLTYHPNKTNKTYGAQVEKLLSDVLLLTPTSRRASVSQLSRTYSHQLGVVTGCSLEDLPEEMEDKERFRKRERERERE